MFTLANPTGGRPTKLPQIESNGRIWFNPSYGPGFGNASGYCIYFMNNTNTTSCAINNNTPCFAVPEGQSFTNFIYGNTTSITMNYLEVFGLKKR